MFINPIPLLPWRVNPILPTVFEDSLTELENIGAMVSKLNELIEDYNKFIGEYKYYIESQIAPLRERIDGLVAEVQSMIAESEQKTDDKIAELEANVQDQLDTQNRTFQQTVDNLNQLIAELRIEMDNLSDYLKGYIQSEILRAKTDISAMVAEQLKYLQDLINVNNDVNRAWIEARLNEFLKQLPNETMFVINPVTGAVDTLQETLYDLYNISRIDALTAQQYDELELTAEEYDSKLLTAYEYDMYGARTWTKDSRFYMFNPFTGVYELVKYVVDDLASLHKKGTALSAEGYDIMNLTAYYYDTQDLTAYDYDWKAKLLLTS